MASPKPSKPGPRGKPGRPRKSPSEASKVRAVRFTPEDCEMIDAIIADEQERVKGAKGLQARLSLADVLRSLVRQEAERRGLLEAETVAQAS